MHVQTLARTALTDVERRTVTALDDALAAKTADSFVAAFADALA